EGAELFHLAGWAQKLAGLAARLAALLHMAAVIVEGGDWRVPVAPETVEAAAAIAKAYLLPHAQAAFGIMGADLRVSKAAGVWGSIVRSSVSSVYSVSAPLSFTRRDLHTMNRRAFPTVEDLDPILNILTDYGYLRFQAGSGQPGRNNKSPSYWVNPIA